MWGGMDAAIELRMDSQRVAIPDRTRHRAADQDTVGALRSNTVRPYGFDSVCNWSMIVLARVV